MKTIDIEVIVGMATIISSIIGGVLHISKIEKNLNNDIKDLKLELMDYTRDRNHSIKNEQNIIYNKIDERLDHIEQNYLALKYQLNSIQTIIVSRNKALSKSKEE
jgi:hypothetical protein